ncbi:MAG TPA: tetratricopeptide repeat protein [Thermoanaerobaculia bacterium]|nr:tetratricopeptide repeat protein [Thermoanaerobaculia bacterium]
MTRAVFILLLLVTLTPSTMAQEASSDALEFLLAKLAADEGNGGEAIARLDRLISKDPHNEVLIYERAAILIDAGRIERAESELRRLVKAKPEFYEARRLLGRLLLDLARGGRAPAEEALEHLRMAYQLDPSDFGSGVTAAQILVGMNRLDEAEKILQGLVEQAPDQRIINYNYAQVLTKLGRGDEAGPYLERVVASDPTFGPAVFQLIDLYRQQNEFARAAATLQPLIEQEPLNLDLQRQQALFWLRGGESAVAAERLTVLLASEPSDTRTKFYLAEALSDLSRPKDAEPLYRQLLEIEPQDPDFLASFGINQLSQRKFDEAEKAFNQLLRIPGLTENMQMLARTQLALTDYHRNELDAALRRAREILSWRGDPNPQAVGIALDVLERRKRFDEALELLAPLLRDDPNHPFLVARQIELLVRAGQTEKADALARTHIATGKRGAMLAAEAYVRAERYEEGIAILQKLDRELREDPDVLFELGAFHERAGKKKDAETIFLQLLSKHSEHAATLNYLGYMWAEQGVNLEEAERMLTIAVSKEPRNGAFVDSLGWVYFQLGKLDLAEKHLTDASRLLPSDPTIQEHLGDLFARKGDHSRALDLYRNALSLKPEETSLDLLRTKIAELEKKVID